MISKIIDSRPEELRTYLEEAAGISKYKEKRRETELRLKHTSENLSRLNDIMSEINSSLTKLQKQARDAELYKELKSCLLYTSPSPRDSSKSRMPSSA